MAVNESIPTKTLRANKVYATQQTSAPSNNNCPKPKFVNICVGSPFVIANREPATAIAIPFATHLFHFSLNNQIAKIVVNTGLVATITVACPAGTYFNPQIKNVE